jgi:glucose-1-phosphate adenylyltransferase
MDISHMIEYHLEKNADVTIAAYPTPVADATRFGVLQVDEEFRITEFQEKPAEPNPIPGDPAHALASMGNYIFSRDALFEMLSDDAANDGSEHDFGKNVLPAALAQGRRLLAYDFARNPIPGQDGPNTYWRDVGTLDSYHEANMDLVAVIPEFDLFNDDWPLRTSSEFSPPAKFVHDDGDRRGQALNSLLAGGVIVSGGTVRQSVLSRRARVNSYALVERSILFDDVEIGRNCVIRNAIIDKNVRVPEGTRIGVDAEEDRARGFTVTENGVTAVPKSYVF